MTEEPKADQDTGAGIKGLVKQVSWPVFAVRMVLSWGGASLAAFFISDYVVESRTSSLDTAIATMNTSLGTMTSTLGTGLDSVNTTLTGIQTTGLDTNRKVDLLAEKLGGLSNATTLNSERIARLQADLLNTQASISKTGFEIKAAVVDSSQLYGASFAKTFAQTLGKAMFVQGSHFENASQFPDLTLQLDHSFWDSIHKVDDSIPVPPPTFD